MPAGTVVVSTVCAVSELVFVLEIVVPTVLVRIGICAAMQLQASEMSGAAREASFERSAVVVAVAGTASRL